jgi:hypothetical protein
VVAAYDGATGEQVWSVRLAGDQPAVPRLDPAGTRVVVSDTANSHRLLVDAATGTVHGKLRHPVLGLGPPGTYDVSAEPAGVGVYHSDTSTLFAKLGIDHELYCLEIALSRDGRFLAWTNRDGTTLVADLPEVQRHLRSLDLGG